MDFYEIVKQVDFLVVFYIIVTVIFYEIVSAIHDITSVLRRKWKNRRSGKKADEHSKE